MSEPPEISEDSPFYGVPQAIVELTQSLTDFVERSVGIRPDFSPETLPLVDHYAQSVREQLKERPELLDLAAQATGAYFGEVVRRNLPGVWRAFTSNQHDWLVCGVHAYVALNPIGVGYDAVMGSEKHGGPNSNFRLDQEDRAQINARLAALPEETSEDYFKLSTRYEILEIVHEGVRVQAEARGYTEVEYDISDYDVDLRPLGSLN